MSRNNLHSLSGAVQNFCGTHSACIDQDHARSSRFSAVIGVQDFEAHTHSIQYFSGNRPHKTRPVLTSTRDCHPYDLLRA